MNLNRFSIVLLVLLGISSSVFGNVTLRLRGGILAPSGAFKKHPAFSWTEIRPPDFATHGENSCGIDLKIGLGEMPISVVVSASRLLFDDLNFEFEQTTYEYPLGTGKFTDFKHRIIPVTIGMELSKRFTDFSSGSLGFGGGAFYYKYGNYGTYEELLSEMGSDADRFACFSSQTLYGCRAHYLQTINIRQAYGLFVQAEYNYVWTGDKVRIGQMPAGHVSHISFYRFELGVFVRVFD